MKNKLKILLLLLFEILFAVIGIIFGIIAFVILNIVFTCVFAKLHFSINIINFDKIKNMLATIKIRKTLLNDERYMKKLKIDTFDGSGSTTHPYILYFSDGFNGYKYWMVHTPYDNNNVEFENPCIVVSNDGINFQKPDGIKEPLLPIIKKNIKSLTYYNDPCMIFDNNELQVWYRYTEETKEHGVSHTKDSIYRIKSSNGINWSKPELMINDHQSEYLSISIIKIENQYYLYYFDLQLKFYCKTSKNLIEWSKQKNIEINEYSGNFWHGEVRIIDNKVFLLFISKDYRLYICEANINNPFEFSNCKELLFNYYDSSNIYGNVIKYKSTFLINDGYINLYIPYRINKIDWFNIKKIKHQKWTMTNTYLSLDHLNVILKSK